MRAGPHSFSVAAMLRLMSVTHALRFQLSAVLPVNKQIFSFSMDYDQEQIRFLVNRTSVRRSELGITTCVSSFQKGCENFTLNINVPITFLFPKRECCPHNDSTKFVKLSG